MEKGSKSTRLAPVQTGGMATVDEVMMFSTSIGGALTGEGGDVIILDDPQNPLQANSETEREGTIAFFKNTLLGNFDAQNAPSRVPEYQGLTGQALDDKLDDILKDIGIPESRINGVELRKVYDGYAAYYDPELAAAMKKAGADYVWSGVNSSGSVIRAVKTGGLKSTNRRTLDGVKITGASPEEDMVRGGADSVFTRIGVKSSTKTMYDDCFKGGPYRILIDGSEFGRTDWYAYPGDSFGITDPARMASRMTPTDFVASMKKHYRTGNEIMFRHGIPSSSFIGVSCNTQTEKDNLLRAFAAENITEINGTPVDKFVKVGRYIG